MYLDMEDIGIKQNVISKSEEGSILRLEKGGCYDIAYKRQLNENNKIIACSMTYHSYL